MLAVLLKLAIATLFNPQPVWVKFKFFTAHIENSLEKKKSMHKVVLTLY